jgi:hypothetical protein
MSRAVARGWILPAAVAFGAAVAAVKGQDTGVRDVLGNLSAPWVLVPFVAGARFRRIWRGALVGVAVTLAALVGFYAAEAAILDLGPHPWYVDLRLTLRWNVYDTFGIFSGILYGALGALWSARRSRGAAAMVGLAFAAEPLLVLLLARGGLWGGGWMLHHRWVWIGEVAAGAAAIWYALRPAAARARRSA